MNKYVFTICLKLNKLIFVIEITGYSLILTWMMLYHNKMWRIS